MRFKCFAAASPVTLTFAAAAAKKTIPSRAIPELNWRLLIAPNLLAPPHRIFRTAIVAKLLTGLAPALPPKIPHAPRRSGANPRHSRYHRDLSDQSTNDHADPPAAPAASGAANSFLNISRPLGRHRT